MIRAYGQTVAVSEPVNPIEFGAGNPGSRYQACTWIWVPTVYPSAANCGFRNVYENEPFALPADPPVDWA